MTAARKNPAKSGPPRRRTRAGLSKAAIYLYFLGNTALFKGVVQHAIPSNLRQVAPILAVLLIVSLVAIG